MYKRQDAAIEYYEQVADRGTGRTTTLYMKAIAEALDNPGKQVEFIDHHPHTISLANHHAENLKSIITKLGYNISVYTDKNQVFLCNKFFGLGR